MPASATRSVVESQGSETAHAVAAFEAEGKRERSAKPESLLKYSCPPIMNSELVSASGSAATNSSE